MTVTPTTGAQLWSVLETGQIGNAPLQPNPVEVDRFRLAMERAGMIQRPVEVEAPVRVAQLLQPGTATDATTPSDAASAANRAVQGLELDPDSDSAAGTGTAILEGLGRMRSIFDSQLDGVARSTTLNNPFDYNRMMELQAQLVEFSLVVDVSSKLAGKSTQALDSLLKGQ
jgi:type III secretion system YscI/HrpB-like protein